MRRGGRRALGSSGQAKLYPLTPRDRKLMAAGLSLLLALVEDDTEEGQDRAKAITAGALLLATGRGEIPISRLPIGDKADPRVPFSEVVKAEIRERIPEIKDLLVQFMPAPPRQAGEG